MSHPGGQSFPATTSTAALRECDDQPKRLRHRALREHQPGVHSSADERGVLQGECDHRAGNIAEQHRNGRRHPARVCLQEQCIRCSAGELLSWAVDHNPDCPDKNC